MEENRKAADGRSPGLPPVFGESWPRALQGPQPGAARGGQRSLCSVPFPPLRRRPLSSAARPLPSRVLTLAAAAGRRPGHLTPGAVLPLAASRSLTLRPRARPLPTATVFPGRARPPVPGSSPGPLPRVWGPGQRAECGSPQQPTPDCGAGPPSSACQIRTPRLSILLSPRGQRPGQASHPATWAQGSSSSRPPSIGLGRSQPQPGSLAGHRLV